MDRREFSVNLAGAAAAAALLPVVRAAPPPGAPPAPPAAPVTPQARTLYHDALILDCNSGPPLPDRLPLPQSDLDQVRASGVDVVKFSLGGINADFGHTVAEIGRVQRLIEAHPDYFTQVRVAGDIARARQESRLGIIFSFESTDMLQGRLETLELFRNLGVRVMQLSYNRRSPFAAGVMQPDGGGLTPLGRQAVAEMNRLGIAIDLSHANAETTSDVLAISVKPPIMSHVGCAALHPHPRN
ncbi:MAG TPA: membrane dipeptidase, partial [Steroidobacteraceae bacterium]|nr:membrane dipeptidase [Steroidobacteraceae bacterium]